MARGGEGRSERKETRNKTRPWGTQLSWERKCRKMFGCPSPRGEKSDYRSKYEKKRKRKNRMQ